VYPISSNGTEAGNITNHFSLHIIAGLSASEKGFACAGLSNIIKNNAEGVQVAGFSNHIMNDAHGAMVAGFMNTVKRNASGAQIAGFLNYAGHASGIQVAGFANVTKKDMYGMQLAGFANITQNTDAQVAGFINVANEVQGLQVAGFINKAKDVDVQAAGFINTARNVSGIQVAGFINVAKSVGGLQVAGFMNIADSCDYPIGLINIMKKGEKAIGISIDENQTALVSFRSGGRALYGIIGVGYNFKTDKSYYAQEAGIGAYMFTWRHFRINAEATTLVLTTFEEGVYLRSGFRIMPAVTIGKRLEIFAGASFNEIHTTHRTHNEIIDNYLWSDQDNGRFNALYLGGMIGMQVKI